MGSASGIALYPKACHFYEVLAIMNKHEGNDIHQRPFVISASGSPDLVEGGLTGTIRDLSKATVVLTTT